MGYCSMCGIPVKEERKGYNTKTGEPIYTSSWYCDDCQRNVSAAAASFAEAAYKRNVEEVRDKLSAGLIARETAWFEERRLRKRYNK